jgi:ubiquinone/menaquinone biosynthesis C-methylase UbiE
MDWKEYNRWFKWHFQREIQDFVTFIIHELAIEYKSRVLEIGAGAGWISLELVRRMPDVEIVGVEQSTELVEIANQNKIQENITNVDFIHSTIENLKIFSNQSFDSVISFKTLRSWNSPQQALNGITRILKSDGKYAITDYRKDLRWLAKASIWFTGRTMPKEFRSCWKESIHNSFSLEEIVKILMQTRLKDWKIRTTLFDYLIYRA